MARSLVVLCGVLALVASPGAQASEEEFLVWNEVQITSPEREDTGKVIFKATANGDAFKSVGIEAFGKSHVVPDEMLARLSGFPLSSLATTHEAGYERLGGHTVSFNFKTVAYDDAGRLMESKVTLSVSKGRGLAVTGPTEKPIGPTN